MLVELIDLTKRRSPFLLLAAGAVLFVLWLPEFWTFVFIGGLATAMVALSVGVVYGRTGMVSLCQFSFAAVGVWVMAWLNVNTGLPFVVMLVLGGFAAVPFGLVIGLLSLRLRGVNLAVATLGFAAASLVVLRRNPFPGSFSNQAIKRPTGFVTENGYFLFSCIVLATVVAALAMISRTRAGQGWLAVRQSERATASLGLSVARVKLTAFSVGAFIAGIGGGLLGGQNGVVSQRSFEPFDSLLIFAVSVLVGARFVDGALGAGLLGAVLPELFRKWGIPLDVAPMLFGIGVISVLSKGADGAHGHMRHAWSEWRAARQGGPQGSTPSEDLEDPAAATPDVANPEALILTPSGPRGSLELEGLSVSYGAVVALDQVSLDVRRGEVHGLIGPNGAGKSTLIDAVAGFVSPNSGVVRLAGVDLAPYSVHRRARMGVRRTFQQGRAIEEMTVGDYVQFAAGRALDTGTLARILRFFDCPEARKRISSIDVATRRLVEVAGCVAAGASIVMLDEPGAGLAETESAALAARISEVPDRFGCGVLLVEHDMEIVRTACDRLTVLDFGSVVASGTPESVLSDQVVIAAYLGKPTVEAGGVTTSGAGAKR